ncbi:Scarecrow-like transcription factor PAT1 [Striga hermonthica]|uniref:Scarecrow-like transcription factor PAT1 n=1 Tax=Striga hermonthica TaxID=68872 RepID=A0A9N7MW13_STRHE|nr:Scarecrow-like transcription factor PAT1 [Striga hermonthica]
MDSRYFEYSVTGTDLSYSSHPTFSSIPTRLSESLKFGFRNSPNSPFSTHFETDTLTVLADTFEHQSSADNLSTATPSCNSSLYYLPNENTNQNIRTRLLELENVLMAPDAEEDMTTTSDPFLGESRQSPSQTPGGGPSRTWARETSYGSHSRQSESPCESQHGSTSFNQVRVEMVPPNNLKQLLIACARALYENNLDEFERLVERARSSVSISGEPIQRLGAYLVESLVARRESSGTNIYRALKCNQPDSKDLLSYMHILYEVCPYLKFGYMAANGAIAEACKGADRIHIVDFQIAQGTQWITLLQALAARPGGPPRVRITGIDDPVSKYARGDGLAAVGRRLGAVSEKFGIPVEFLPVPVFASDVTRAVLDVRPGEALAVNFPLQLHHTPDESVDVSNPRDGLLRMVKSLSPRVVTLVEQESNTNTAPFLPRFVETLDYYSAMFESIDVTMARDSKERINVEQQCLARDIVNIVACEGKERVERHELFGKWRLRLMMAGFQQFPLSSYVNSVIRGLLRCYSEHYTLVEKDGAMLLGWKERNLVSASAWR